MPEPRPLASGSPLAGSAARPGGLPPRTSLATKLVLFVFLATFGTAVLVSWTSIQATRTHLGRVVEQTYPATLARAAERLEAYLARGPVAADALALSTLLAREALPPGGVLLLLDADGRVLAASQPGSERAAGAAAALRGGGSGVHQLRDAEGRDWIGTIHTLAGPPLELALLVPFDVAFEPVIGVVTRLFVIDFSLVLLASFLAFRVTAAVLRPIEILSDGARRIAQGQIDHEVPEPATRDEIGLLARTFNDMLRRLRRQQAEIESRNRDLRERNAELQQAKETFEQLSITDGLTKLHNHRFFQDHLTREILRAGRSGEPLSMLLVDLDDFKQLNDRLGHAAGDELLAGIARILNQSVRATDLLARYGGEEFVVLLPDTDLVGAERLAEKIRTTVGEASFILDDSLRPVRVTVSIGAAQFAGNRKGFFKAADRALYRAKDHGKNCVVVDAESAVV
jgi:diguanylate cyclase (GGDEF)-like protein